jgi:class 3 adenylate cyclase/tetratricopeptide (TPR) repeat protein
MRDDLPMNGGVTCPACQTANAPGAKFCSECGTPLARNCSSCGAAAAATAKFCAECGAALAGGVPPTPEAPSPSAPTAERRVVTVLFADLVGFTPLSESRDAEEVRELLSQYFETARSVIERYGGRVEKFIGDAVMALWGAPVAQEDDAERGVRAALELVSAVEALGADVCPADLHLRAGVLTGEAAVTLGAEGEGMVAGDLVNTASRIQSAAEPGTVLVGDATRRASGAAIAYEDAGTHDLKGKTEALQLWRALRVIANRGGEGRAAGLEPPFVGRDRELRLVKELFHATAEEGKAHILSVVGIAGIGKSRLAWEFEKYLDGLVANVWWHKGRCLAYGDAIAYWSLAEMVRMRARISEEEPADSAQAKLHTAVEEMVDDPEERAFVEPRLQQLLGLSDRTTSDREDLFSGWRMFFERMAERGPVLLLFEDIQWADTALVEFVEYLLEWSRNQPIFVITLARPELVDRHPGWGSSSRRFSSLFLEPLPGGAIDALLQGLVPGLSDEVRGQIRDRADGIPLYAVETVRMLLDRGLLERVGDEYRPVGTIDALDVPETLQALIAARLDGLAPDERRLLGDASVLGKTFSVRGLAALSATEEETIRPLLAGLVRKEVLVLESDPRSPERGQYGFLQALVQRVAYETLSRHDRKAKHLRAAEYLATEAGIEPDEIAEVIAAHYLDAFRADEQASDAAELEQRAREWLIRAGERAAALAATQDARRAFDQASALVHDPLERAPLVERSGMLAIEGDERDIALARLEEAVRLYEAEGRPHDAARAAAALSRAMWTVGRIDEALALLEPAFEVLSADEPDADVAALAAESARIHHFRGDDETAMTRVEFALDIAEAQALPEVLSHALNTKALLLRARPHESRALQREALDVALEHDLAFAALRAYNNLCVTLGVMDRPEELRRVEVEALDFARRRGGRAFLIAFAGMRSIALMQEGDWDGAFALADEWLPTEPTTQSGHGLHTAVLAWMALERDDRAEARRLLDLVAPDVDETSDVQLRAVILWRQIFLAIDEERIDDLVRLAGEEARLLNDTGYPTECAVAAGIALDALQETGDVSALLPLFDLADGAPAATHSRRLELEVARGRGVAASLAGEHDEAADWFGRSLSAARNLGDRLWAARVLADYARALVRAGRADEAEPLAEEAREAFEQMGAKRALARLDAGMPARAPA